MKHCSRVVLHDFFFFAMSSVPHDSAAAGVGCEQPIATGRDAHARDGVDSITLSCCPQNHSVRRCETATLAAGTRART